MKARIRTLTREKKWDTHRPESVLENETHQILWDFEIQMDYLILTKRPDQWNENLSISTLCYSRRSKNERKKQDNSLDFARELKKTQKYKGDSDTNLSWSP